MGKVFNGIPPKIAIDLLDKYSLRLFVETGTHLGKSAIWASKYFDTVVTIEANDDWYRKARRYCSGISNIKIINAKSEEVLGDILRKMPRPCMIWLDAHWSRDLGYRPDGKINPVLDELEWIRLDGRPHVILVDDARLFGREEGWPGKCELITALDYGERSVMVIDDVYISIPGS